jgi:O-antigen/teichoic acid export membrane protein
LALRTRHIARNVLFNWFGTIVNLAVGFFLSPFIVHRLGDIAFGIWGLAISVVAYMSLLDFGMQSSVLRFVNKGHTQHDHQGASDAISATLWIRLQMSLLIVLLSVGLAAIFPHFFKIPPALARASQIAVLLIGLRAALTMSIGVFGAVLSGLNRYDLQNYVSLAQTAIRVVGVVAVLRAGHGIVAIGICELIAAAASSVLLVWFARRLYPELRIHLHKPRAETFHHIWNYSVYAFLTTVAVQLVYQSDNLVVGKVVSVAAVTFYMIANNLCSYTTQVIEGMGGPLVPAASTYEAAGDTASLLNLYKNGTRALLAISLPILITLIIRGPAFIGLWMGPKYAHRSGMVLIILATARIFSTANRAGGAIAFGTEKHRTLAIWAISEGLVNLSLSIVLAHWLGIYGVALGTLIPSLFVQTALWPRYVRKLVGLGYFEVIGKVWAPMFFASLPFAAATYCVNAFFPAHSLLIFMLQVAAVLPIFVLSLAFMFRTFFRTQLLPRLRSLVFASEGRI